MYCKNVFNKSLHWQETAKGGWREKALSLVIEFYHNLHNVFTLARAGGNNIFPCYTPYIIVYAEFNMQSTNFFNKS